jgi:hypothetical protein
VGIEKYYMKPSYFYLDEITATSLAAWTADAQGSCILPNVDLNVRSHTSSSL